MKKKYKNIYIYAAAVIILGLLIYAVPKVTDVFETTEILEVSTLRVEEEATCYFVRSESVYVAASAGTAEYTIEEGTHIRKGTKVLKFKADSGGGQEPRSKYDEILENNGKNVIKSSSMEAQSSGVLCYSADGYESKLTPDTMEDFTWADAQDIKADPVELKEKKIYKSEPIFKICDNDNWYLVCWVESASVGRYEVGSDLSIQLPDGTVDVTVQSVTQDGDRWRIIFWSNHYYETFAQSRVEDGLLISKDYTGLIVKNSSIMTKDGKMGVMVLQKNGEYEFTRINVIASDGEYSALTENTFTDEDGKTVNTVQVYDEILKHPGKST